MLISTDQTSLYSSLVGNSINASVGNYITAAANRNGDPLTEGEATLAGLSNSVEAMIDDILTCYASAQLMVANDTQNRTRFRRISSATVRATRLYRCNYSMQRPPYSACVSGGHQNARLESISGF
jgi:hypothetical protein